MDPDQPAHPPDAQSDQDPCCSLLVSLLVIGFVSKQHGSWSDCVDGQAGLDPCWSQIHYVGFVVKRLKWSLFTHLSVNTFMIMEHCLCGPLELFCKNTIMLPSGDILKQRDENPSTDIFSARKFQFDHPIYQNCSFR
jgi:hypothetical protein